MDHWSRTHHLVPSRCQESLWSRSIGGGSGVRNGRTPGRGEREVVRTAGSGGEGGDASGVNCYPQRKDCKKSRSA